VIFVNYQRVAAYLNLWQDITILPLHGTHWFLAYAGDDSSLAKNMTTIKKNTETIKYQ
jgi:hypothetical protein